jgi:hypothetical protein
MSVDYQANHVHRHFHPNGKDAIIAADRNCIAHSGIKGSLGHLILQLTHGSSPRVPAVY